MIKLIYASSTVTVLYRDGTENELALYTTLSRVDERRDMPTMPPNTRWGAPGGTSPRVVFSNPTVPPANLDARATAKHQRCVALLAHVALKTHNKVFQNSSAFWGYVTYLLGSLGGRKAQQGISTQDFNDVKKY